jgi:HEAT repeat protein
MRQQGVIQPRYAPPAPGSYQLDPSQPETSVEAYLDQKQRVMLVGVPGAGKSTTLHRLTQLYGQPWLDPSADLSPTTQLPLFVALNRWQNQQMSLANYVREQVQLYSPSLAAQLPALWRGSQLVLLLDGLNELPQLNRDKESGKINDPRSQAIARLGQESEARCVLTCRVKEFEGGPDWHNLLALPLERAEIESIATAFYRDPGLAVSDSAGLARRLVAGLFETKDERIKKLQDHARTPFYLRYLLAYFYGEQKLPANPARLIDFSVEEAFQREIEAGRITPEETDELRRCLAMLAFNMTEAGQVGAMNFTLAAAWLFHLQKVDITLASKIGGEESQKAKQLLEQAEQVGLVTLGEKQVTFYHQLMQEYFCALFCIGQPLNKEWRLRFSGNGFSEVLALLVGLDQNFLPQLLKMLEEAEDDLRWDAASILARINDPSTFPSLINALKDPYSLVREYAASALGNIGDPRAVQPLYEAFQDHRGYYSRIAAIEAIGKIGGPQAVQILIGALHEPGNQIRKWSIEALTRLGSLQAAVPSLLEALQNPDRAVRQTAASALGEIGDPQAVFLLGEALKDQDEFVRYEAIVALGEIGDRQAVPALIEALNDEESKVRYQAAEVLGRMGDAEALSALEKLAREDESKTIFGEVKDAATKAIEQIKARQKE